MCESFFARAMGVLLNRRRSKTPVEERMALFDFIKGWYNPYWRHSALDYRSPTD